MHFSEVKRTLDNAMHGAYKLLYLSPERLQTYLFRDYLPELDISLVAIDEAHCVSQWGHDFRPSYLKIAELRDTLKSTPFLALTATATPDVREDISLQLKLRKPAIFRQSFARNNIFYAVSYSENKNVQTVQNIGKDCSIVYCRSRKQTEAVAKIFNDAGIHAAAYHAGMAKEKREEARDSWMNDRDRIMVATTAFGMGIDKAGVRMVLHHDAPEHLEAWYQEAGRAGRDGNPSSALTLYNSSDIKRLFESTDLHYPPEAYLRRVYQAVVEYLQIAIGTEPDQYYPFDLSDFCRKFSLQANEAIHALKQLEREGLWTLSESVYSPATIQFLADRYTLDDLNRSSPTLGYVTVGLLRMYNTIFHYPTHIREGAIARQLKMKLDELLPILHRLDNMGILKYNRPGEGPQLFFHHYRVDSRHLLIDLNRIHILRKRHEARTEAMISFLENNTVCREKILLLYFGEQPKSDCGHCDVCRSNNAVAIADNVLAQSLFLQIKEAGSINVSSLVNQFTPAIKTQALSLLRDLADQQVIFVMNGMVSLKPKEQDEK